MEDTARTPLVLATADDVERAYDAASWQCRQQPDRPRRPAGHGRCQL